MKRLHAEEETRSKLQQSVQQLEAQISQTQLLLDKEKAKYQGAWRQQEVGLRAKGSTTLFLISNIDFLFEHIR